MKNPFAKLFKSHQKTIPEVVKTGLVTHFPKAVNIEWENKNDVYEAIFYVDDVEHIALVSSNGQLTTYKKNLWPKELPEKITNECRQHGEIMNAIAIFNSENPSFEVIVRDATLTRILLLFDESSALIESKKL